MNILKKTIGILLILSFIAVFCAIINIYVDLKLVLLVFGVGVILAAVLIVGLKILSD